MGGGQAVEVIGWSYLGTIYISKVGVKELDR